MRAADVVITMGCGDACPIYPGKRYEDWVLDDPAETDLEGVRRIRDDLDERIQMLVSELIAESQEGAASRPPLPAYPLGLIRCDWPP